MEIRDIAGVLGAEVTGLDLSRELGEAEFAAVRQAFLARSVLVIRDQQVSERDLVAFSRRFGPLEPYESTVKDFLKPGHPEIILISNLEDNGRPLGLRDAGQYWHTDRSYVADPSWASVLYALEVPLGDDGVPRGDTLFASTVAAFAALPAERQDYLRTLRARHRYVYRYTRPTVPLPDIEHPLVRRHHWTGREAIYVNAGFTAAISDLPETESERLLQELYDHMARPDFVYRHRWRQGDIVMWDNCAVQHKAVGDYALPMRRLMWRTTVKGWRDSETRVLA